MDGIRTIVETTLDRIEERAYARGRQEALADAAQADHDPEPVATEADDETAGATAALVLHMLAADVPIGESVSIHVKRVQGKWDVTVLDLGPNVLVTATRRE